MNARIRPILMAALLLVTAACSKPPAAEPNDAPNDSAPVDAPGSSEGAGGGDRADEPYPGAQPVDGRSPTPAYPGPGEAEDDASDDAGEGAEDDASDSESDESAADADASAAGGAKMSLDETFASDEYGFAIDYPTGWFVDDSGSVVMLRSEDTSDQPGTDGVPPSMTKIDIVQLEGFPLDIETRVSQIREELDAVNEEERFTLMSGEAATWLRGEGGMAGDTGIVVTILDGQLYQIQAYGNPAPLRAIAYTFRVAE